MCVLETTCGWTNTSAVHIWVYRSICVCQSIYVGKRMCVSVERQECNGCLFGIWSTPDVGSHFEDTGSGAPCSVVMQTLALTLRTRAPEHRDVGNTTSVAEGSHRCLSTTIMPGPSPVSLLLSSMFTRMVAA